MSDTGQRSDEAQQIFVIFLYQYGETRLAAHGIFDNVDIVLHRHVEFQPGAAHVPIACYQSDRFHIVSRCPAHRFHRVGARVDRAKAKVDAASEDCFVTLVKRCQLRALYVPVNAADQHPFGFAGLDNFQPAFDPLARAGQHDDSVGCLGRVGRAGKPQCKPDEPQRPEQNTERDYASEHGKHPDAVGRYSGPDTAELNRFCDIDPTLARSDHSLQGTTDNEARDASTVFSITIAAVAYASGNYGPRLLSNFMNDRGNQLSLAVFIATFVYAVMVLRVIRSPEETSPFEALSQATSVGTIGFVPQLSLLVATILMALAVAVLVYFLNHVPASIRINTVLESIGSELLGQIRKRFPVDESRGEPASPEYEMTIRADRIGYVQIIDFSQLGEIAKKSGRRIAMSVRPGDFVHPDIALVSMSDSDSDDDDADKEKNLEDLTERVRDCFSTAALRSPAQDIEFLIDEIVEISLRALSPGINDPFTAITAMHWAGAAMSEIAGRGLNRGPEADSYDNQWLYPLADDFDHFLRRSFGSMRSGVASSPLAARQFLSSLRDAGVGASSRSRIGSLRREGEQMLIQARLKLDGPDLEELEQAYAVFERDLAVLIAQQRV